MSLSYSTNSGHQALPVVSPALRRLLAFVLVLFGLLVVNSLYLVSVNIAGQLNSQSYENIFNNVAAPLSGSPLTITSSPFPSALTLDLGSGTYVAEQVALDGFLAGVPVFSTVVTTSPASCPAATCADSADMNDDGLLDISDPIYGLAALFSGGPQPPDPGPVNCGPDPTDDSLGCSMFDSCP